MIVAMADDEQVTCRAQESENCMDGWPVARAYPDGIEEDFTWDGSSVVCDECFIALGCPNDADLP